jgi:uncharacterized protein (DUF2252 family)
VTPTPPNTRRARRQGTSHPSVSEREARGKEARKAVPRSSHAGFSAPKDRRDPLELLAEQARTREPSLVPIRHGRMAVSPFSFFRGSACVMAADLAPTPRSGIEVQLCGDAHLANFGGFATPDGGLVFDLGDFDETVPGPWEWDVKRMAASLEVAARERGFGGKARRQIVTGAVARYRASMRAFAGMRNLDVWYAQTDFDGTVDELRSRLDSAGRKRAEKSAAKASQRENLRAFSHLTEVVDGEPRLVSDPPLLVPIGESVHHRGVSDAVDEPIRKLLRAYRDTLDRDSRGLFAGYRYVDLAHKVVGVGSVGTRAWIVLLLGRDEDDPLFLQVKEAQRSVLEPFTHKSAFRNQGRRVVEGQRLMQAAGDSLLGWIHADGMDGRERDFYVRQLWDCKASPDIDAMDATALGLHGDLCGSVLARAHARSGDRVAIGAYLGRGDRFDRAVHEFAEDYADQNERDHKAFVKAIKDGRVEAREGI